MLDKLKLLHAYLGGLVLEAEAGALKLTSLRVDQGSDGVLLDLDFERVSVPTGCDHEYRRVASGEYECRVCGSITDEPEGEQWN